jgi:hypothetical protein
MGEAVREILSDPLSNLTLRRAAALLVAILLFALLASENRADTFARLCALNAFISMAFALLLREPALGAKLNRWDEALVFGALWIGPAHC